MHPGVEVDILAERLVGDFCHVRFVLLAQLVQRFVIQNADRFEHALGVIPNHVLFLADNIHKVFFGVDHLKLYHFLERED